MTRDLTPEQKDDLLSFLIGHMLWSTNRPQMLVSPELVEHSITQGNAAYVDELRMFLLSKK
jgi:hypothetical protein